MIGSVSAVCPFTMSPDSRSSIDSQNEWKFRYPDKDKNSWDKLDILNSNKTLKIMKKGEEESLEF